VVRPPPPGGGQTALEQRLAVLPDPGAVKPPGPISAAYNAFIQRKFLQGIQRFKFRDHSEIFMDQGEERWCSFTILTRIRNLSKVATKD
jgi:hypothetical protein